MTPLLSFDQAVTITTIYFEAYRWSCTSGLCLQDEMYADGVLGMLTILLHLAFFSVRKHCGLCCVACIVCLKSRQYKHSQMHSANAYTARAHTDGTHAAGAHTARAPAARAYTARAPAAGADPARAHAVAYPALSWVPCRQSLKVLNDVVS